VFADALMTSKS